jgi:hypothetical protein
MPAENPTGKHTVDVCEKCGARRLPDEWNPPSIEIRESDAMHSCPYDDALNATEQPLDGGTVNGVDRSSLTSNVPQSEPAPNELTEIQQQSANAVPRDTAPFGKLINGNPATPPSSPNDAAATDSSSWALTLNLPLGRFDLFDRDIPTRPEIIEGIVRAGQIAIIGGNFNAGKSPMIWDLMVCIVNGLDWCGRKTEKRPVIHLDFESGAGHFRKSLMQIAARRGVPPPTEGELDLFLLHDDVKQPRTKMLMDQLQCQMDTRMVFLRERLRRNPRALLICDPFDHFFPIDKRDAKLVTELYMRLKVLLSDFPEAATLLVFNLRKDDFKGRKVNLLSEPHSWLQKIAGSGDILNRCDVRLGFDFLDPHDRTIRILHGARRGEDMEPLLIRPVGEAPDLAGFERVPARDVDVLKALSPRNREHWAALPMDFSWEEVKDSVVPHTSLSRLIKKLKALNLLEELPGPRYRKCQ